MTGGQPHRSLRADFMIVFVVVATVVAAALLTVSDQPYSTWPGGSYSDPARTRTVTATGKPETPTPTAQVDGGAFPAPTVDVPGSPGESTPTPTVTAGPTVIRAT